MNRQYKISEVAELLGISPSAIRFYEKKGLFKAKKDPESGYRYYGEEDIKKLWSIVYYRNIDMSLEAISRLKRTPSLTGIHEIIDTEKREALKKVEEELKKVKVWEFYEDTVNIAMLGLEKFTKQTATPMHLFHSDYLYRSDTSIFPVGSSATIFDDKGKILRSGVIVHERHMDFLGDEDIAAEEETIPPFPALFTVAEQKGDPDISAILQSALEKAKAQGFQIKPPYYVIFLLTTEEWENKKYYYEIFMPLEASPY